jgi:predicted nucleic acid-binding protein
MKYVLDTDTLIDFLQDVSSTRTRIIAMLEEGDELAFCSVTMSELFTGLSLKRRDEWHDFFASLPYWDISREAAMQSGIDRKTASESGRTLNARHIPTQPDSCNHHVNRCQPVCHERAVLRRPLFLRRPEVRIN